MAEETNKEIRAKPKGDSWKNWLIIALVLFCGGLLYYQFNYAKEYNIEITGEHLFWIAALAIVAIYLFMMTNKPKKLPQVDVINRKVAEWYFQNGYGTLDLTNFYSRRMSDQRQLIYYPGKNLTLTFDNEGNIIEVVPGDMDYELIQRERSELLKQYAQSSNVMEKARESIENKGYIVEDVNNE